MAAYRYFQFTFQGIMPGPDLESAKLRGEHEAKLLEERGFYNGVSLDVQIMPREYSPNTPIEPQSRAVDGVIHPWDQGLSIFPLDHPLRRFEDIWRDKEAFGHTKENETVRKLLTDIRRHELNP